VWFVNERKVKEKGMFKIKWSGDSELNVVSEQNLIFNQHFVSECIHVLYFVPLSLAEGTIHIC